MNFSIIVNILFWNWFQQLETSLFFCIQVPLFITFQTCLSLYKKKKATSRQNQQCICAPREDSDQPGHLPNLIRVFAVCMKKAWVLSYLFNAQWRLWSDWADAQADLSLHWAHTHFVGFVMRQLKSKKTLSLSNTDNPIALQFKIWLYYLFMQYLKWLCRSSSKWLKIMQNNFIKPFVFRYTIFILIDATSLVNALSHIFFCENDQSTLFAILSASFGCITHCSNCRKITAIFKGPFFVLLWYRNDPKFLDRHVLANSVDLQSDNSWKSSLFRVYTVCHSV